MTLEERITALAGTLTSRGWLDIIIPALEAGITTADEQLMNGIRPKGQEKVSDDMLKGRILAFRWILGWKDRQKLLIEQLDAIERLRRETDAVDGELGPFDQRPSGVLVP